MTAREERDRIDALPTPMLRRAANPMLVLAGTSNVVMQLARPEIGHAVSTSDAPSALFNDHVRRRRTTVGYLAVATHGTAAERAAYRRGVNVSHAPVPGAMDPRLQWWVAACLYRGFEQTYELVHGPADREALLAEGVVLGGLLQVPAADWPASRAEFEERWREGLAQVSIDDAVRDYLMRVVRLEYLPKRPAEALLRRRVRLVTGFLPEPFREEMRLAWSAEDQRWFERFTGRVAGVVRHLPAAGQEYPFRRSMRDLRTRLAAGAPAL